MKYYIKTIYPLLVLAVFFGLLLSLVFQKLNPKIEEAQEAAELEALLNVFPKGQEFLTNAIDGQTYYMVYDSYNDLIGYIFKEGETGYGGAVLTLVGINLNAEVQSIYILSADQETPGLGYKCMEKPWQEQYSGLTEAEVPADKAGFDKAGLSAITGATITSMAVADNIALAFDKFSRLYTPETEEEEVENGLE